MGELTVDVAVEKYIELRQRRSVLKKEFEEADAKLKDLQSGIEGWLDKKLLEVGVDSMKSEHGTAYVSHVESMRIEDWDDLIKYVKENDAYEIFTRAVNKTYCRELMQPDRKGNYSEPPPPGIKLDRIRKVNVRKK